MYAGRQCLCALIPSAPLRCFVALEFGCHQPGIYQTAAGRGRLSYTVAKLQSTVNEAESLKPYLARTFIPPPQIYKEKL